MRQRLCARTDQRFPALDGMRAIAALLIVFFHSAVCVQIGPAAVREIPVGVVRWVLNGCWIGVDVFFVLSGFLIGRILLTQLQTGSIDFKGFYTRRVFRIFPAYYVVLTLSLFVFSPLDVFRPLYGDTPWHDLLRRSPANYLYVSNYLFPNGGTILGWGWSLCIEEHFYLVFPLLVAVLFRWLRSSVRLTVLCMLPIVPAALRAVAWVRSPNAVLWQGLNWESHTHCDGLLLGALIAYAFVYHRSALARLVARLGPVTWIAGFVCIAAVFAWGGTIRPGFFAVVPQLLVLACGSSLLLLNGLLLENRLTRLLGHPFWYPIARVSYGIYLIHLFVILWLLSLRTGVQVLLATSGLTLLAFAALASAVSFAAAGVMFLVVELPLLERGIRISRAHAGVGQSHAPASLAPAAGEVRVAAPQG